MGTYTRTDTKREREGEGKKEREIQMYIHTLTQNIHTQFYIYIAHTEPDPYLHHTIPSAWLQWRKQHPLLYSLLRVKHTSIPVLGCGSPRLRNYKCNYPRWARKGNTTLVWNWISAHCLYHEEPGWVCVCVCVCVSVCVKSTQLFSTHPSVINIWNENSKTFLRRARPASLLFSVTSLKYNVSFATKKRVLNLVYSWLLTAATAA